MKRLIRKKIAGFPDLDDSIVGKKTKHNICFDFINNGLSGFSIDDKEFDTYQDVFPEDGSLFDVVIAKLVRAGLIYGDSIVIPAGSTVIDFKDVMNGVNLTLDVNGHKFNADFTLTLSNNDFE